MTVTTPSIDDPKAMTVVGVAAGDDKPFIEPTIPFFGSEVLNIAASRPLALSKVRVLLVEDEAPIRDALAEALSAAGYEVETADNGAEALRRLHAGELPAIILLDLMMPVMDGWEFRLAQKNDQTLAHIPVIVFSANVSSQARAIDASAFISKPLTAEAVQASIESVLSRMQAARLEHAERLASLGTLTAGVAHEIANPLTYVIANLQLALKRLPRALSADPLEIPDLVAEALDGAVRIGEIVGNIQTVARVGGSKRIGTVDLRAVAERAVKLVEHELRHRARIELRFEPVSPVLADARRIEQVVLNLLVNATHAVNAGAPADSVIRVATRAVSTERVRLEVADSGPGVPPGLTERIFDPFFTTKPAGVGTGLGLSICRAIIEDAGGKIGVDSGPFGGALFWFELPVGSRSDQPDTSVPVLALRTRKIVAVDDDPRVLGVICRHLEPQHDVRTSTTVVGAIELAVREDPDVILCDVMMPEMSATVFVEHLRARAPALARRVVFMTAGAFGPEERSAVDRGEHTLLRKPFTKEQLEAVLGLGAV